MPPPDPATANMNFEQTYDHFTRGGPSSFVGDLIYGYEHYYAGGSSSQGLQVGPSSSAWYDYENSILWEISQLTARVEAMGREQQRMNDEITHNTALTQESRGMSSSTQHDVSSLYRYFDPDSPDQQYY